MKMMKKLVVLLCFFAGAACFLSAAFYINRNNAGLTEQVKKEEPARSRSPELLSEINMPAYVSLPASFETVSIQEEAGDIEVTNENVEEVMYDQLLATADRLDTVWEDTLLIVDFTVSQNGNFQVRENDYWLAYTNRSTFYDDTFYQAIAGLRSGESARVENVKFDGYEGATVDIAVKEIIDMPYPVTDEYINSHTEYSSVYEMQTTLVQNASGTVKESAREQTINDLIDTMMDQTTFIELPESLVMKELDAMQKEDPNALYEDAKHSLNRIFFIAAVIEKYDLATKTDMEKRYANLPDSEKEGLTTYEIERKKYLLFEEDVVTYIYKKVKIN